MRRQRTADFEERMTSKCTLEKGSRVGLTLWGTVYGKTDTGASMVVVEGKANTAGVLVLPKDTQGTRYSRRVFVAFFCVVVARVRHTFHRLQ